MRCAGQGSIRERPEGSGNWQLRQPYGRDPVTGKYRVASRSVRGTKTQARQALDDLRRELETGLSFDGQRTTFVAFATEFEQRKYDNKEVTLENHKRNLRLVRMLSEQIGDVVIGELDSGTCERALAKIRNEHPEYSGTYRRMIFAELKRVLADAALHDLIMKNPCDKLKAPKLSEPARKSFTPKDYGRLMVALDSEGDACAPAIGVRLAAVTGMRRGEVLGLDWGSVDLSGANPCIRVVASLNSYNEIKPPKSKAGVRVITIDDNTVSHLMAYKAVQAELLASWGITQTEATPVITDSIGGRFDYYNFNRWRRRFFVMHGLGDYDLHELRHTQATVLLASGADIKTVQRRMGHAQAALTLDLYGHAMPGHDRASADAIAAFIQATKQSDTDSEK